MKRTTVLSLASLFSFVMLPFSHADQSVPLSHADQSVPLSDLHQKAKGRWELYIINGHVPFGYPALELTDIAMFGYLGDCNHIYIAINSLSENNLQNGGSFSTLMSCGPDLNEQEDRVLEAFEHTTVVSYDEATDALTIGSEENTLVFKRARHKQAQ